MSIRFIENEWHQTKIANQKEVSLEQLEEMKKELFKQQCDLDIQKAMVKHFIKKKKAEQLTLTDVVKSF